MRAWLVNVRREKYTPNEREMCRMSSVIINCSCIVGLYTPLHTDVNIIITIWRHFPIYDSFPLHSTDMWRHCQLYMTSPAKWMKCWKIIWNSKKKSPMKMLEQLKLFCRIIAIHIYITLWIITLKKKYRIKRMHNIALFRLWWFTRNLGSYRLLVIIVRQFNVTALMMMPNIKLT